MKRQRKASRRKGGLLGEGKRVEMPGANRIPVGLFRPLRQTMSITVRVAPDSLQKFKEAMERAAGALYVLGVAAAENAARAVETLRPFMEAQQKYWEHPAPSPSDDAIRRLIEKLEGPLPHLYRRTGALGAYWTVAREPESPRVEAEPYQFRSPPLDEAAQAIQDAIKAEVERRMEERYKRMLDNHLFSFSVGDPPEGDRPQWRTSEWVSRQEPDVIEGMARPMPPQLGGGEDGDNPPTDGEA